MQTQTPLAVKFPVKDFKRIETPLDRRGYRNYLCVVDVLDLPDLKDWNTSNVRDAKSSGRVPDEIRTGLIEEEIFFYLNRGLVIVADKVDYDNKAGTVEIRLAQPGVHGIIDGGHTRLIIAEEKDNLEQKKKEVNGELERYVKLELLVGFELSEIKDIAGARNTSNQVRDESLLNLANKFDRLKDALRDQPYFNEIAFQEYELKPDGTPKSIDVREIISILYMFDIETFQGARQPINAYSAKASCIKEFKEKVEAAGPKGKTVYDKLYHLLPELLRLCDEIHLRLPGLYSNARKEYSDASRGDFGRLTGVVMTNSATRKRKGKPIRLQYNGKETTYRVPSAFIYPLLGAFRALLEEKSGKINWIAGCDPLKLLEGRMGMDMVNALTVRALDDRNPNKTGKSAGLWQSCYQAATQARLEAEIAALKRSRRD